MNSVLIGTDVSTFSSSQELKKKKLELKDVIASQPLESPCLPSLQLHQFAHSAQIGVAAWDL